MKKYLLTLFLVFFGCAAQAHAGGSVHVGFGGYAYGYRGFYGGYGYRYYYAPRYYAPIGYGGYGGYGGYDYAYPITYDDSSQYAGYSSYPVTVLDSTGVPPSASVPANAPTPAPVPQAAQKQPPNQIPYGFDTGTKLIKSPWSSFVINGANKAPEQVVYDANTGQAFRIPSP
jgi:hypothetical protein